MENADRWQRVEKQAATLADADGPRTSRSSTSRLPEVLSDMQRLAHAPTFSFRRTIRRTELRQIVPLADTTIYDMERRGEFPKRFNLTSRCVVWDLSEVETWINDRRMASNSDQFRRAPSPDVRQRKRRPIRPKPSS